MPKTIKPAQPFTEGPRPPIALIDIVALRNNVWKPACLSKP